METVFKLSNDVSLQRNIMTLNLCTANSTISSRGPPNLSNFSFESNLKVRSHWTSMSAFPSRFAFSQWRRKHKHRE